MKTSLSIRLLALLNFSFLEAAELPFLLEVKKDTPLFSRPSMKSERLAEAEAGTMLLFLEKSKKGIWLRLRDADGSSGWMPAERTDYKEVKEAQSSIEEIQKISSKQNLAAENPKQKTKEEMMEEIHQSRAKAPFSPSLRIAPIMRWLSDAEPASTRLGLRVDYNLGKSSLASNKALDPAWASLEATFPAPQISHSSDFTAAARYVWRAPLWGPLVYGPDIGYSVDSVQSDYRHHLALGLSAGFVLGPVDIMLRGGYDFFAQSRMSVELQMGLSF